MEIIRIPIGIQLNGDNSNSNSKYLENSFYDFCIILSSNAIDGYNGLTKLYKNRKRNFRDISNWNSNYLHLVEFQFEISLKFLLRFLYNFVIECHRRLQRSYKIIQKS